MGYIFAVNTICFLIDKSREEKLIKTHPNPSFEVNTVPFIIYQTLNPMKFLQLGRYPINFNNSSNLKLPNNLLTL